MKANRLALTPILLLMVLSGQTNQQLPLPLTGTEPQTPILYREYDTVPLALEKPIDPETYLLGPGDRLRINISGGVFEEPISGEWALENIDNYILVDPTGNLIVPRFGSINVLGMTLAALQREVSTRAKEQIYEEVQVAINLIRVRTFRILAYGAVNQPGFITVSPVTRLIDCIRYARGVQKYAHSNSVYLIRNGKRIELDLRDFLLEGDLESNPVVREGDTIYVPFNDAVAEQARTFTEYNKNEIIVTGFVRTPGRFAHIPGYSGRDYIAMAGGILDIGNEAGCKIIRADGTQLRRSLEEVIKPGDIIDVPEAAKSKLFKNMGAVQSLTSVASLVLAWMAIDRTNSN
ncbi:MAG: polysaccharide biosynthesis/export family protein [Candidatus Neomarinimicrobiota bacterium]|nr:polysaccharide biosynthesis/export family protein [Candidatus Neomarinimicrobiota bacterium]